MAVADAVAYESPDPVETTATLPPDAEA
jgi:hypothetical protein